MIAKLTMAEYVWMALWVRVYYTTTQKALGIQVFYNHFIQIRSIFQAKGISDRLFYQDNNNLIYLAFERTFANNRQCYLFNEIFRRKI